MLQVPYKVISWQDPEPTGAVGWIVIHNLVNGIAGGGLFMHESACLQEVKDLAYTMSLKNALQRPVFGGGKGGIRFDAKHPEAKMVLARFLQANSELIRSEWCTGGDINTTTLAISEELQKVANLPSPFISLANMLQRQLNSKPDLVRFHRNLYTPKNAFFTVEQAMTGFSLFKTLSVSLTKPKPKIIVQGFGKIGKSLCYYLQHYYTVVGVCERDWFIHDPQGIFIKNLLLQNANFKPMQRMPIETEEDFLLRFLQQVRADVFCPCALRYSITDAVLTTLSQYTFAEANQGLIVAGANNVFADYDLIDKAFANGITVIPEWLANSGSAILFMEALKYNKSQSAWVDFIKQEIATRIASFITQAKHMAQTQGINFYQACTRLAQSIVDLNSQTIANLS